MKLFSFIGRFSILLALISFSVAAENLPLQVNTVMSEAALFNVRMFQKDGLWLVRGRVTRYDRDVKVSPGSVRVVVLSATGEELFRQTTSYKPTFVHRKADRASYFTIRLPDDIVTRGHSAVVNYQR